ncbi:MAG TPA: D-alanyl-D-alanine carboxypeptidase family protein [Ktedonobacterales bacterium]|jgi:D-alanyl-D-alanine carboxypeptidase (penicillin-binding protein 5/6)
MRKNLKQKQEGKRLMRRIFLLSVAFTLVAEAVLVIPILAFTPIGDHFFKSFAPPATPTPRSSTLGLQAVGAAPIVQARAAYLIDADTGKVLLDVRGSQRLPMASTAKIMTAILAIETAKLDQTVTIKQDAVNEVNKYKGSSAGLVVGDQMSLRDLLYGLMLPSGDDAAIAIADAVGGNASNFVQKMNSYAKQLGLTQTHYVNPDGLTYLTAQGKPDPNQYSSAGDLARLARHAMANPFFAQLVQLQHYVLFPTNFHHAYIWDGINSLLSTYPGATGVKTGYTEEAGYCLVFAATNGQHHLIGALLHDTDDNQRYVDARALLDWGFGLPVGPTS